ncbi:RNA-directed DNA polymerase from mobile element jockey [Octopus vulgaris]|uniref:RNA-directed DNA polymerase from mobile element jockey n=1 Tax=Octopus vulgaris TaxID=6645 RepID=A0AA36B6F1_OCTVU|nr:RNA-directed DNA polymerase from mobile element jockey [Octopus vulgaris]
MPEIKALIMKVHHVRLPKMIFSELASGARNPGRPLRRYKDSLKTTLEACGISARGWESLASDRDAWLPAVQKGFRLFKEKRLKSLDQKRQARKERIPNPTSPVMCPTCGRICASAFGFRSHLRRH